MIAISYKVHDQTVGKVLKKVREGREDTTSKSEKGRYINVAFSVQRIKCQFLNIWWNRSQAYRDYYGNVTALLFITWFMCSLQKAD